MGLTISRIQMDDKESQDGSPRDSGSNQAITEAVLASRACNALVNNVEDLATGESLLLCPLREGPISAIRTMRGLVDGRHFDKILPTYIAEEANTPRAREWLQEAVGQDFNIDGCTPISGVYDGGSGEMVAACSQALSGAKAEGPLIAANVLLKVSAFTELSATLEDYLKQRNVVVGYAADARDGSTFERGVGFPRNVRIDVPSELESVTETLRSLLDGDYGTSPLRSVEVVRAVMLHHIAVATGGVDALKLWKKLDRIYQILADKEKVKFTDRNEINRTLRSQLSSVGIVTTRPERGNRFVVATGDSWATFKPLLDVYLSFAGEVFGGQ